MKKNGELIVCKSNELIQKYKFSLSKAEMRVVNFIIANINSPLYDEEFNTMIFDISDFYKAMGIDNPNGQTYTYIKNVIRGLRNKTSDWIQIGDYETIVSWIEKPKFFNGTGKVELKLDDDLKPYLLKMNGYMQAQLNYYYQMHSKYSMRLYELLKTWEKAGIKEFEIEDLRMCIDAYQKSYTNYAILKSKVLDPAIQDINKITDLTVSYETKKRGRKVTHIEFTIKKKTKEKSEEPDQLPGQIGIYDYLDVVPENTQTAEDLYVQRVNDEAFNSEFTVEKAAYLVEIGKARAQERVSEDNIFDAEAANAEKIGYYREKYLQMRAGSTSKTVAGRAKYLEKILIADRDEEKRDQEHGNQKNNNKFNNFKQRDYNISDLEQQLLRSQK
jgi:hypothetical protein